MIGIYQLPGANALAAGDGVQAALERLAANFPPGLGYDIVYDTTAFVKASVDEVEHTLIEAFVLVILVVFLFLGSWRATLIPLLAVPVALIGTFAVMLALGFSLNTVSLLAIVLAIGIVVDDAIVVVENVERVMEENPGLSAAEAAHRAMGEITGAIVAITLVLLSVFVPVAFIPGISGQLFQQFAVAVSVSMVLSAINALTLSPALCAILLKPHHGPKRGPLGWISRRIDGARDGYVARRRRHRPPGGRSASCSSPSPSAPSAWLFRVVPDRLPAEPRTRAPSSSRSACPRAPRSTAPTPPCARSRPCSAASTASPTWSTVTGYSFLDGLAKSNSGFAIVSMLPFDERTDPAPQRPRGDRAPRTRRAPAIREAQVFAFNLPPIIGLGTGSGFEYQLLDLEGRDPVELAGVAGGAHRRRQPGSAPRPDLHHLLGRRRRSSSSTSTASGCRPSASRSATSSPRCRARSARSTSTTSTSSAAPGR